MVCIYHNRDLDGFTSAAIVKKKYENLTLIGYDYGDELPYVKIPKGEPVIMVDCSLPMDEMYKLAEWSYWRLIWIDHHISAINDYEDSVAGKEDFLNYNLEVGRAACELTWEYLFPEKRMPEAVRLLGAYDTWRNNDPHSWYGEILPFQYGMRSQCNSPESFPMHLLEESLVEQMDIDLLIGIGKEIISYDDLRNELSVGRAAFPKKVKGYRAICLNTSEFSSKTFDSVYDEEKHDIMVPFQFNGEVWKFSIYSTKDSVDCSSIAKQFGGGGHRKAAGFRVKDLKEVFNV